MSAAGKDFLFRHEAQDGVSNHLHWPGGGSGVTLGPGYDMRDKSADEIATDMMSLDISQDVAREVARASRLHGEAAHQFSRANKDLVDLNHDQELRLLSKVLPTYENIVQRNILVSQTQAQFDALVSFCYNPGASFVPVAHRINAGKSDEAMDIVRQRTKRGNQHPLGLIYRRFDEINLYLHGIYAVTHSPPRAKTERSAKMHAKKHA